MDAAETGPVRLFGLAAGGVCRAVAVTRDAVRPYRTISPLPAPRKPGPLAVCFLLHFPSDCSALTLSSTGARGPHRPGLPVRTFLIPARGTRSPPRPQPLV